MPMGVLPGPVRWTRFGVAGALGAAATVVTCILLLAVANSAAAANSPRTSRIVVPRALPFPAATAAVSPARVPAPSPTKVAQSSSTTVQTTSTPPPAATHLSAATATKDFLASPKVASWLRRYPANPPTGASYANGVWTINVFFGAAGEIATGTVDDVGGAVTSAWTGPQVAWGMARGGVGFGGKEINSYSVWLTFCAIFLLGLVDWRRILSLRNLDLVVLVSFFSVSLWFFNRGHIFAAMPLVYPAFAWLILRCLWVARRNQGPRGSVVWPTWVLIVATLCLAGYRIDLNVYHSNVIDVGLSGVIGADRIASFQSPYGHFPIEGDRPACGPADSNGEIRDRIQTNGRCEAADAQGDTYGPVAYEAYLPGFIAFGWSGKWDSLPTAHATSILWDLLAIIGLWFVGVRFGGPRLGAILAFAWSAWPLTQYASSSNTNDLIEPALLVWAFYFVTSPVKRGWFAGLAAWTKFAPILLLPLWSGYPTARSFRPRARFLTGFALATAVAFVILLFDRSPLHNATVFFHHTFGYQFGRSSPFSLWDWRQYHAKGLPNLRWVQRALYGLLIAGALALVRWPRDRSPLQMAAYSAALLVGFESVLTHWSWLYLPWFFPFVAFALLAPRTHAGATYIESAPIRAQARMLRANYSENRRRVLAFGAASAVFVGAWALLRHGFYANPKIFDTSLYQLYGTAIRDGKIPYKDFGLEYPPGALPAFLAPTLDQFHYRWLFGWLMAGCGVGCLGFAALTRPSRWALPFLAVSPLLVGSLAITHFDFWPTLFVVAALAAFVHDRHRLGWAALGFAFAIKLFAFALLPLAAVWTFRRRDRSESIRCIGILTGVIVAVFGPFAALSPQGMWNTIHGELSRPIQIETLFGSWEKTFGNPRLYASHGSIDLVGHEGASAIMWIALASVLSALWIGFARGPADRDRLIRYAAAAVCAAIVLGKVFSPQFVIWLVPLVPLVRGRRGVLATGLLTLALLDMLVWFPGRYYEYVYQGHLAWLVLTRNAIIIALLVVLAAPELRRRHTPTATARYDVASAPTELQNTAVAVDY